MDPDVARSSLHKTPKRLRGKAPAGRTRLKLFHWNELPDYLKDNKFIVTGYRADTGLLGSIQSLFRIHNESGNVWSHLCGMPSHSWG